MDRTSLFAADRARMEHVETDRGADGQATANLVVPGSALTVGFITGALFGPTAGLVAGMADLGLTLVAAGKVMGRWVPKVVDTAMRAEIRQEIQENESKLPGLRAELIAARTATVHHYVHVGDAAAAESHSLPPESVIAGDGHVMVGGLKLERRS